MIKIYGTPVCTWCTKAKETAELNGMEYTYIDITEGDNVEIFTEKFPNAKTVPQIEWHGRHIGGYTDFLSEIENTIGGYGDGKI